MLLPPTQSKPVSDYITLLPYVSAALFVIGSIGLLSGYLRRPAHSERVQRRADVTSDHADLPSQWRPSGKIDFTCPKFPKDVQQSAPFVLRIEEYCVFQSPAGTKHVAVRWRDASLAEARHVASRHNAMGITFERELPVINQAPKLVGDFSFSSVTRRTSSPSSAAVPGETREIEPAPIRH